MFLKLKLFPIKHPISTVEIRCTTVQELRSNSPLSVRWRPNQQRINFFEMTNDKRVAKPMRPDSLLTWHVLLCIAALIFVFYKFDPGLGMSVHASKRENGRYYVRLEKTRQVWKEISARQYKILIQRDAAVTVLIIVGLLPPLAFRFIYKRPVRLTLRKP